MYNLCRGDALYSAANSFEISFARNLGILRIYTLTFNTSRQQHLTYQKPAQTRTAARINHQNFVGRTSDSIIISPAAMAIQPSTLRRPLRIKTALPADMFATFYAEDGFYMYIVWLFQLPGLMLCAKLIEPLIGSVPAGDNFPLLKRLGNGAARFLEMGAVIEAAAPDIRGKVNEIVL